MPISSGGEGHVGIGVDTSIKWMPNGRKDYWDFKSQNSYLKRYCSLHGGPGGDKINTHEKAEKNLSVTDPRIEDDKVSLNERINTHHQKHGHYHPDQHHNRLTMKPSSTSNSGSPSSVLIKKQASSTKRTMDPSKTTNEKSSACTLL